MLLKNPSLELAWLKRGYSKELRFPPVAIVGPGDYPYGGAYYSPWPCEVAIGGKYYDRSDGLIVVAGADDEMPGTLAHEWRHHEQFHAIGPTEPSEWSSTTAEGYWPAVLKYFRSDWSEMDALLYQHARHPTDWSGEVIGRLHGES